jgi:non-specific serine/threonine protein kinase
VLDEAQEIKNSDTEQSRAARAIRAPSRFALTGTPVENRLTELWTIMEFANPGLLGSEAAFRNRFSIPIERWHDEAAAERLRRISAPFVLRRVKTDRSILPDLPAKLEFAVSCTLTREQATLYQSIVDDLVPDLEGTADEGEYRGKVLRAILRLKQVCNHPALLLADGSPLAGRSGKLARLEETLDTIVDAGERALVFTQFAEWGERLVPYLRERFGREVLFLHGGTPRRSRDELVARFETGTVPIFVLSLKAGGKGLNLVAANHVLHYDRWWNPAVEDQASDRAYRIGQTRDVQVRTFVAAGTLEEHIAEMLAGKRDLAARIVRAGERAFTDLSPAELRDVLTLSVSGPGVAGPEADA